MQGQHRTSASGHNSDLLGQLQVLGSQEWGFPWSQKAICAIPAWGSCVSWVSQSKDSRQGTQKAPGGDRKAELCLSLSPSSSLQARGGFLGVFLLLRKGSGLLCLRGADGFQPLCPTSTIPAFPARKMDVAQQ